MSDTDNMQLAYVEESSFGIEKTGSLLKVLRYTGESLAQETTTGQSAEIRSDRQVACINRSSMRAAGGVNFELSYGAQDDMLKSALMADSGWTALPSKTATTIAAVAAGNKLTGTGFDTAGLLAGQRILVSGFTGTDTTANGIFTISTASATELVLIGGATLIDDAAGESVTIQVIDPKIVAITISAAAVDNSLNDSGNGFLIAGFAANQWIKISGFSGTATTANGYAKIASVVAGKMILSGVTLIDDAAGESVTIQAGAAIVNGSTMPTYNIEKKYVDLTQELALLLGLAVDQASLNVSGEGPITGSLTFLGSRETSKTATAGSGYTAAPTNDVMNAVDNVVNILEGASAFSARTLTVQVQNNLRTRLQLGTLGAISLGKGKCAVSGTLQAYFTTKAIMDKYLNFTSTSLAVLLRDTAGNAYIVDLPRVKYMSGRRVAGGENQDIIADLAFSASMHPTETVTIRIVRFAA